MRYLLFGASITHGVGDPEHGGWAGHLRKYLDMHEGNNYFTNLSIAGDTSRLLLARFENEARLRIRHFPREDFTIIITVGTNDSRTDKVHPETDISEKEYQENLRKIFTIAQKLAGKVLAVGFFPVNNAKLSPYKDNLYYTNERARKYNALLKAVAAENNVPFLDTFDYFMAMDYKKLFPDGIHPNPEGHRLIFEKVKEFMITNR